MAPIVHCIRHAQGYHNLSVANHSMPDPSLTPVGEEQCEQLKQNFPYHDSVELLVASPLRRTVYTALNAFTPGLERGMTIIALPEAQETADVPCDTGTDAEELKKELKGKPVDLSRVERGWNIKKGRWAPTTCALEKRAREARQWLKARPEKEIVLVTHGGFLHYFTEDWSDYNGTLGTGWQNVEFRSFLFVDGEGDNATIVETEQSRKSRRGTEKQSRKTEHMELLETAKSTWEEGGNHPIQAKRRDKAKDNREWIGAY